VGWVCGWAEDAVELTNQTRSKSDSGSRFAAGGIGIDSTSVNSAPIFGMSSTTAIQQHVALYRAVPSGVGLHFAARLENASSGCTFYGAEAQPNHLLTGMAGMVMA
jgi:hypothetical protein